MCVGVCVLALLASTPHVSVRGVKSVCWEGSELGLAEKE